MNHGKKRMYEKKTIRYYFRLKGVAVQKTWDVERDFANEMLAKITQKANDANLLLIGFKESGWIPLFQETAYYKNGEELIDFYYDNKDILEIVDGEGNLSSVHDLMGNLLMLPRETYEKSRCENDFLTDWYYRDEYGFEFKRRVEA